MITNYENYGPFVDLVKNGQMELSTSNITKENYDSYFNGLLNIMRDGIETPEVQHLKITIYLEDNVTIRLTVVDTWFQLIFWTFPIFINDPITAKYFVDTRAITKKTIKSYFNQIVKEHMKDADFITLNNLIDETIYKFKYIDEFAMYLSNTVNFRDTLDLMEKYPDFNEAIHADLTGVPLENVKKVGMDYAQTQIKYIKNSDHCLRDSFIAQEAINPKQFKEVSANIGTKPDGHGGIFPYIINNSFMNGGVSTPESYVIDSSVGRTAQILQKMNVGTSGAFARLLETNNLDTFFNPDPREYSCNTKNFIKVEIKDSNWLSMYDKRYYRFRPDGPEYLVDKDRDDHLIGQTLYFRSPMTCASYAHGHGLCRKCYGDLYYVNRDINPGKIAAELLSSIYTQMLLSAKHLLESAVIEMKWNPEFYELFQIDLNMLSIDEETNVDGMYMILDSNTFDSDDSDDADETGMIYDEFTPSFDIVYPDGRRITFHTQEDDNIYITEDLNKLLKSKKTKETDDGIYTIPLDQIKKLPVIFTVQVQNKELQRTLERSKHIINRDKDTSTFTKDEIIKEFITANTEGGINLSAVHLEVILANQMRDPNNILEMPDWSKENAPYKILTLGAALDNSPSITTTFEYQKIGKNLVNHLSTKKRKASVFDLYFMQNPQNVMDNNTMISDEYKMYEDNDAEPIMRDAIYFVESDNGGDSSEC
jgi:hypothetical protein